jgi:hypothetical protein
VNRRNALRLDLADFYVAVEGRSYERALELADEWLEGARSQYRDVAEPYWATLARPTEPSQEDQDAKNIRTGQAVMDMAQALVDNGWITPSEQSDLEAELENTRRQRDQNARLFKDFEDHHARQLAERDKRIAELEAALKVGRA